MAAASTAAGILPDDFGKLQRMLGAGEGSKKKDWGYRNYYAAPTSGESLEAMRRLEVAGLVKEGRVTESMIYFHATEAGCKALGFSAAQIKKAFED